MNLSASLFNLGGPDLIIILLIPLVLFLILLGGVIFTVRMLQPKQKPPENQQRQNGANRD